MKRWKTVHGLIEDFVRPQLGRADSFRDKIKKLLNETVPMGVIDEFPYAPSRFSRQDSNEFVVYRKIHLSDPRSS
jgi:hypothetical protein